MNRELRIKETLEQKVYFTSDTHFHHDKDFIFENRGYADADAHTTGVRNGINERVRPNDILVHLGDICLNTLEEQFERLLASINCQNIYHIWGNHNNPAWLIYRREVSKMLSQYESRDGFNIDTDVEIYPFRYKNIVFLGNYVEMMINGYRFVLSHYPLHVFNYLKRGAKHLCGHSHGDLEFSDQNNLTNKILDVGWDDFGKVLSLDEVLTIMNKKSIFRPGDHH